MNQKNDGDLEKKVVDAFIWGHTNIPSVYPRKTTVCIVCGRWNESASERCPSASCLIAEDGTPEGWKWCGSANLNKINQARIERGLDPWPNPYVPQ